MVAEPRKRSGIAGEGRSVLTGHLSGAEQTGMEAVQGGEGVLSGFACRLQMLRRRRRMSQRTLSELAGLSKNMVARYEKEEAEPSVRTLVVLADFFDVTADYLLGREEKL